METRHHDRHLRLAGPQGWDFFVENIGAGQRWLWFETKLKIFRRFLDGLYEEGRNTLFSQIYKSRDDDIVVFMDGEDVMFGGCDLEGEFVDRFLQLEKLKPGAIFFGAEYNCFEGQRVGCDNYRILKGMRRKSLDLFGNTIDEIDAWGETPRINRLIYVNSGFVVGRVTALRRVFAKLIDIYLEINSHVGAKIKHIDDEQAAVQQAMSLLIGDQGAVHELFHRREDPLHKLIVPDYAGVLVNNVVLKKFRLSPQRAALAWDPEKMQWIDGITNKSLCFMHMAGGREKPMIRSMEGLGHDYQILGDAQPTSAEIRGEKRDYEL